MKQLDRYFGIKKSGSSLRVEIMAGLTTFFAMAYIIIANPNMLSQPFFILAESGTSTVEYATQVKNSVFIATCLASAFGTLMIALYAKLPFAQAPGMGLNAFFAFSIVLTMNYTFGQALAVVFVSGLLFILITAVGLREAIYRAIPKNVRLAISAGIGLFITLIGLFNSGLVVGNDSTVLGLRSFNEWNPEVAGAILAFVGLMITGVLMKLKVKGAILISIILSTIIGIPMGVTNIEGFAFTLPNFGDWVSTGLFKLDFTGMVPTGSSIFGAIFSIVMVIITFSLVDMFDTIGTLVGTATKAGMIDEEGNMPRMKEALMSDAVATSVGALLGTSTVTTFVESSTGISEGGRTGMTSLVTGICFLLALVLAPLVGLVPSAATAPAFIIVGVMMLGAIKEINFDDITEAIPAFLTIVMMPFAYSIATGIAFGLISHVILKACTGKFKEISPITVILAVIFIVRFAFMAA